MVWYDNIEDDIRDDIYQRSMYIYQQLPPKFLANLRGKK
jgi:hypothetical protein